MMLILKCAYIFFGTPILTILIYLLHQILGTEAQKTILPVKVNHNLSSIKISLSSISSIIIPCGETTGIKQDAIQH